MSRGSALASAEIGTVEKLRRIAQAEREPPFRILAAGDFSGGAGRNRQPIEIDRDRFDQVRAMFPASESPELESAWGGLHFLTDRLQTGEDLKIFLLDLPRGELTSVEFMRALAGEEWAVIAGLFYFAAEHEEELSQISLIARSANAPFLAGLAPETIGTSRVLNALRQSANAPWIGLATPRILLRADLWGNPAIACAFLLGEMFTRRGWKMRPGAGREIEGLQAPYTELPLPDGILRVLIDEGLMPLVPIAGTDRVRLVRFQSIAEPAAPLAGRWA